MAKKSEAGIEYFPINSDMINHPKIRLVVAEFGSKTTWAVLLPLYCKIYREKGYWIDWFDEDSKLLFAQDECKIEMSVMNEFVNGCIRRSLFNKEVFDLFGVLTSDRIQDNYLTAKARNKSVVFIGEFACKNEKNEYVYKSYDNVHTIDLDVSIIVKKVTIFRQKKNENKITEEEGDSGDPPTHTQDELILFERFQNFIKHNTPNVGKMKEPFTIDQYLTIKKEFRYEQIKDMLTSMHNYKPLLTKNISAYLTFLKWSKKEYNDAGQTDPPKHSMNDAIKETIRAAAQTN